MSKTEQMEEGFYRMSVTESILVLIVIGLWLIAIISLIRKLERICNPPSIFVNYSLHTKTSLSPSTLHQRYPNDSIPSTRPSPIHFSRAVSEPTIDASPRTTIDLRSPSETCLHRNLSSSQQVLSPSLLELGQSNSSLDLPRHSGYRIHVERIPSKHVSPTQLLYHKRMPTIIKNSLLDLHRRALTSRTISNSSINHSPTTRKTPQNRIIITSSTTGTIVKKKYQRENAVDEDDILKSPTSTQSTF